MATINCDVIRDLLPLYVDGVLSPDSRKLVDEHLADCSRCRDYHEKLLHTKTNMQQGTSDDGAVIRKIRKKIKAKRRRAVCLTAVLAALIVGALWYVIAWNQRYVPFDSNAFTVNNDHIVVQRYYRYVGCLSPEEGTHFFYLTTTVYDNWQRQRYDNWRQRQDIVAEPEPLSEDDLPLVRPDPVIKKVYYVPKDYAKRLQQGRYWLELQDGETEVDFAAKNQELLEELKAASVLIETEEGADTGGSDNR